MNDYIVNFFYVENPEDDIARLICTAHVSAPDSRSAIRQVETLRQHVHAQRRILCKRDSVNDIGISDVTYVITQLDPHPDLLRAKAMTEEILERARASHD